MNRASSALRTDAESSLRGDNPACQSCCLYDRTTASCCNPLSTSSIAIDQFADGDVLYRENTTGCHVRAIRSGMLKLVKHLPDGGQRIVRILGRGDLVGMELLGQKTHRHTAVALGLLSICRIPLGTIESICRTDPDRFLLLVSRWVGNLERADRWITEFSTGPVAARVARLIRLLHSIENRPKDCAITLPNRVDIAAMIGVAHETVCRQIGEMQKSRILQPIGKDRYRCNLSAIEKIANGE